MRTTGDTRSRILRAATELFRRQGYAATGMKQIVTVAEAPYGSAYHFFPGGKAQLAEEVIRTTGEAYLRLIGELFTGPDERSDPALATSEAFTAAAETLHSLDYADPCPIATIALEVASTHDALRRVTEEVFASWTDRLAGYYAACGIDESAAHDTALSVIATLEGAFMLGRSARSTRPVLAAATAAAALVRAAQQVPG